jgi:hypothetical protein
MRRSELIALMAAKNEHLRYYVSTATSIIFWKQLC